MLFDFFKRKNKIEDNTDTDEKENEIDEIKLQEQKSKIDKVPDELIAEALKDLLRRDND